MLYVTSGQQLHASLAEVHRSEKIHREGMVNLLLFHFFHLSCHTVTLIISYGTEEKPMFSSFASYRLPVFLCHPQTRGCHVPQTVKYCRSTVNLTSATSFAGDCQCCEKKATSVHLWFNTQCYDTDALGLIHRFGLKYSEISKSQIKTKTVREVVKKHRIIQK